MSSTSPPMPIERRAAFGEILKEDVRFATGQQPDATSEQVNGWFDKLMLQSGIQSSPVLWLCLCLLVGVAFGGLAFVLAENLLLTAVMFVVGLVLPIFGAMFLRNRRQSQIMEQLPGMADELARAARTGRSLDSCLKLVAADTPAPLGDEMRNVVRQTEMGIDPGTAVSDLPVRTGVDALTMFTSAVKVHQETGGDLMHVLERLATSVRDRLHFAKRLRATTIASWLGAIMMIIFIPGILVFHTFMNPNYLNDVMASRLGQLCLALGFGLLIVGTSLFFFVFKRSARY